MCPRYLVQVVSAIAVTLAMSHLLQPQVHATTSDESTRRPNFVLIMADDLGYGDVGCYGNQRIRTPSIDALARGGLRFTDFHSSGTVCSPTRCGLMTGRYQQRAGIPAVVSVNHKHLGMATEEITFAERLKDAEYATAIFGKWHLGYQPKFNPIHQGFDQFVGYVSGNVDFFSHVDQAGAYDWWHGDQAAEEEGYVTHLITKHALEFIRQNAQQPFCLYLAHEAPHYPYQGPNDRPERTVGGPFKTQGSQRDIAQAYREMVEALDESIGQVMAALVEHKLSEKTLVLFFSDNGANQNGDNGPLRGFKGSVWEGGHRVPGIAYWPGRIEAGRQCDTPVITLDIFPTVSAVAGVALPERKIDGVDLSPLLFNDRPLPPRPLFWGSGAQRAMRDGDWKLVVAAKGGNGRSPMLFHLGDDPSETTDLAAEHPDRVAAMQQAIAEWDADVGPSRFTE